MGTITVQEQDVITRVFGDIPLYEAEHQLHLIPNTSDKRGAKKLDPWDCVLSRTCKRLFGSTAVAFFGTRAYVDRVWRGKRILERFIVPKKTQTAINEFDKTGIFPLTGFILLPPSNSQTLEYQRTKWHKAEARKRDEFDKTGYISYNKSKSHPRLISIMKRNGHGMVRHKMLVNQAG